MKYLFLVFILFCTACITTNISPKEKKEVFNEEISKYGLTDKDTIVDIGCGDGAFDAVIKSYYPHTCFVLEELSPGGKKSMKYLHAYFPPGTNGKKHCSPVIVLGTDTTVPLPSNQYKHIICRKTVHEFTHPDAMLLEMKRILRRDGTLIIMERAPMYLGETDKYCKRQYLSKETVVALLEKNGFKLLDIKPLTFKNEGLPANIFFFGKA